MQTRNVNRKTFINLVFLVATIQNTFLVTKTQQYGLLNNGAEEGKGNELAKEVYGLLKEDDSLNFIGNVEARDILTGAADVVVTDGFTGNAVLKTIEGTALDDDGTSKRRHQGARHPRKTWSALTQEYVLRIKEYIGLLTIRRGGTLWS